MCLHLPFFRMIRSVSVCHSPNLYISGVYFLDENKAYADMKGTKDLLLLRASSNWKTGNVLEIKIYVAKGKKNDWGFIQMWLDGEFDEEMKQLEAKATPS